MFAGKQCSAGQDRVDVMAVQRWRQGGGVGLDVCPFAQCVPVSRVAGSHDPRYAMDAAVTLAGSKFRFNSPVRLQVQAIEHYRLKIQNRQKCVHEKRRAGLPCPTNWMFGGSSADSLPGLERSPQRKQLVAAGSGVVRQFARFDQPLQFVVHRPLVQTPQHGLQQHVG